MAALTRALGRGAFSRSSLLLLLLRGDPPPARGYAKKAAVKGKGKVGVKDALQGPEVCKDPVILTTHAVGVNIYKQGTDPKLLPDTEYPECALTMHKFVSGISWK